ncbi:hypothetical protein [Brevundimonas sp. R86498]|uniref:hypothetical protein n=1 Tax=Brevundimonas sp. R86498 TaxID=3093845 RepID=UPI0037C97A70
MTNQTRADGALIAGATVFALILMLHHPTSFEAGHDDGLFLADWSNVFVHAAIIGCLLALAVGLDGVRRRLDQTRLLTRAGAILFGAGFLALAGAALVNGFATGRLLASTSDPMIREAGGRAFWALNQSLTALGTLLVALGAAAWSPGLWRLSHTGRVAAGLGIALAALALWHTTTDGGFGLHVAVAAMAAFALWSLAVAAAMILARPQEGP